MFIRMYRACCQRSIRGWSSHHINILAQYLKTNEYIGYVVLDVNKKLSAQALELLKDVKNTIKTRLLY